MHGRIGNSKLTGFLAHQASAKLVTLAPSPSAIWVSFLTFSILACPRGLQLLDRVVEEVLVRIESRTLGIPSL